MNLFACVVLLAGGCTGASNLTNGDIVALVGRLAHPPLCESSGVVASRRYGGICWTHNDSGNAPVLYAIRQDGSLVGEFKVDAPNVDWEDIAIDQRGRLYVGDLGNNGRRRQEVQVYCLEEPDPRQPSRRPLAVRATYKLRYPDKPFDCEALFVHEGWGFVISKVTGHNPSIYRFSLGKASVVQVLEKVTELDMVAPVTAADISADGKQLAVLTNAGLTVYTINADVASAAKAPNVYVPLLHPHAEACCFVPEGVLVTAESREVFLVKPTMSGASTTRPAR